MKVIINFFSKNTKNLFTNNNIFGIFIIMVVRD